MCINLGEKPRRGFGEYRGKPVLEFGECREKPGSGVCVVLGKARLGRSYVSGMTRQEPYCIRSPYIEGASHKYHCICYCIRSPYVEGASQSRPIEEHLNGKQCNKSVMKCKFGLC